MKHLILLLSICALSSLVGAQDQKCQRPPRWMKHRLEKHARWLVSTSLRKRIANRSHVFGPLVQDQRCNWLGWAELQEDGLYGTVYLVADGVTLQSILERYRGVVMMAVVPWDGNAGLPYGKMPDANLLEITDRKWTLIHRDKDGSKSVVATEKY